MIAILLTVIAVIGIIALYATETKASSFSRHSTEASTLAADKLEQLRTDAAAAASSEPSIDSTGVAGGIFERAWTLTSVTTTLGSYMDITVRVGWDEDEAVGATCASHATCGSGFCRPSSTKCAGRAVVLVGRRNNQ